MTGYQEVPTDPSYKGQIVAMTYPLIGNCGEAYRQMSAKDFTRHTRTDNGVRPRPRRRRPALPPAANPF
jgi:carbamoylphosphate synthase small subunit